MASLSGSALFGRDFDSLETGRPLLSRGRTITEADLVGFSALTGDWHPAHSDAVWAAGSEFGERVAHGLLVLSFAVGLVDYDSDWVMALRRVSRATFKAPVKIGDTIRVEVSVGSTRPLDARAGLVETRWRVLNQHEKAVAVFSIELIWRRAGVRPAAEARSAVG